MMEFGNLEGGCGRQRAGMDPRVKPEDDDRDLPLRLTDEVRARDCAPPIVRRARAGPAAQRRNSP